MTGERRARLEARTAATQAYSPADRDGYSLLQGSLNQSPGDGQLVIDSDIGKPRNIASVKLSVHHDVGLSVRAAGRVGGQPRVLFGVGGPVAEHEARGAIAGRFDPGWQDRRPPRRGGGGG